MSRSDEMGAPQDVSEAPAGTPPALIDVSRLSKSFERVLAVDDLSFTVRAGEILGLVGPNGAGKTTTLRALAGIVAPTSGTLRIAGRDIIVEPVATKRELALIPDTPNLFESLTVLEHFEFTARIYDVVDWRARTERLLEEFELLEHRQKMADELSRGMRQKVAVGCALLHDPRVLLLDEPFTGLDPLGIRTLFDAVRRRVAGGAAAILSSHLLGQIESLCTSFLIVDRGRLVLAGSKEAIRAQLPELRAEASLEEIFFEATRARRTADATAPGEGPVQPPGGEVAP